MPVHTHLNVVNSFSDPILMEQIEQNLVAFFDWGLLEAGAFVNVPVGTPGTDDPHADEKLYPLQKDGVVTGKIWQSTHANWCYEVGLDRSGQPFVADGVYINGVFHQTSTTTGSFAHYLDFVHGRAVFNSPIPTNSLVQIKYSYRQVGFYSQAVPWFRPAVLDAFLLEQSENSGIIALLDDYRVSTPLVVVEAVMRRDLSGMMLGSGTHKVRQDVLFHVIAETKQDRDKISDIITFQQNKTFYLFDINQRRLQDRFALDWKGSLRSDAVYYPGLVASPWKRAYFVKTQGQDINLKLPLFRSVVRATIELEV